MYSNKRNVNILTSLLVRHGIRHVVVCPGSRNAPVVHNLNECPDIICHPVTDERSAGFYALGISQALDEPVAVCVTSGTALLNLAPAVAEASYQHRGIIVISADRPQAWIDQLDGQTLPQQSVFGSFVSKSISLPEVHDEETHWYCNRIVNEALNAVSHYARKSVHINIPISEPLFEFETKVLEEERMIGFSEPSTIFEDLVDMDITRAFCDAMKPMIVIGQYHHFDEDFTANIKRLSQHAVVLYEPLGNPEGGLSFDEVIYNIGDDESYLPDFLLYCGDTVVSKRLKKFLRKGTIENVYEITEDGEIHDTFQCVDMVHDGSSQTVLYSLCEILDKDDFLKNYPESGFNVQDTSAFVGLWQEALQQTLRHKQSFSPSYSQMAAVRLFENSLDLKASKNVHYANSTAIRLANIYARHYVYCNRGVNGIEGSLSTAAGFSLVTDEPVFCVIGDLSFFYDSNALWNRGLKGNLRILLLNNGGGGIFQQLPIGDGRSKALSYVMANHETSAEGICQSYGVEYLCAHNEVEMEEGVRLLLQKKSKHPLLLEVFTDSAEDARILKAYYHSLDISYV